MTVVGVIHPGEMGAAVGATLRDRGHSVLWASSGRSAATAERARELEDAGDVAELVRRCDVLVSICPPHAALAVAQQASGFAGIYVDANAIAPETARTIGTMHSRFVDGGIVGPPPLQPGTTRLYLSGGEAKEIAGLFAGTTLDARVIPGPASALKAAYAGWTKGSAALLLAMRELARREGVEDALLAEWRLSIPELEERLAGAERSAERKGWRWVGEMEEISLAMADQDLPPGFHEAAADVFRSTP